MKNILNSMLDLVFPPRCEVCGEGSAEPLCAECFTQIKFMKPHYGIYSAAAYDGVVKTAIHRFKYQKRSRLAGPLGVMLVRYISEIPGLKIEEIDRIIPVPLHHKRLRARGFNQAARLAQVVGKYYEKPVTEALARMRDTHSQFDLPREKRLTNVSGAFKVTDSRSVFGQRVMLVDDIYTTGATIAECSRALKVAGAKRIEVLTLSRAVED